MARYHLPAAVHAENDTAFGRVNADFPAGDVDTADEGEEALLAWLVDVGVAELVHADTPEADQPAPATAAEPVPSAAEPVPAEQPAAADVNPDDHQEVAG